MELDLASRTGASLVAQQGRYCHVGRDILRYSSADSEGSRTHSV